MAFNKKCLAITPISWRVLQLQHSYQGNHCLRSPLKECQGSNEKWHQPGYQTHIVVHAQNKELKVSRKRLEEMNIYKHPGQDEKKCIKLKAHHIRTQTGCPMGCVTAWWFQGSALITWSCLAACRDKFEMGEIQLPSSVTQESFNTSLLTTEEQFLYSNVFPQTVEKWTAHRNPNS